MEKSGPNATFNLTFLGLGWPWVGEFDGFITLFTCFPTQQNLAYRKHPYQNQICCVNIYGVNIYRTSKGECMVSGSTAVVAVLVLVLTRTHRYNAARGHRTGSNNSGAEDYIVCSDEHSGAEDYIVCSDDYGYAPPQYPRETMAV